MDQHEEAIWEMNLGWVQCEQCGRWIESLYGDYLCQTCLEALPFEEYEAYLDNDCVSIRR